MPVKAVVCHVGAPSFEILHLNLTIIPVEVRPCVLLLELQQMQAQSAVGTMKEAAALHAIDLCCVLMKKTNWRAAVG